MNPIEDEPMNQPPGWWVIRISDSVYELIQRQRKTTAEYQLANTMDMGNPGHQRLPGKFADFTQMEATVAAHHAYICYRSLFESDATTRVNRWFDILKNPDSYPDICLPALYSCIYTTLFDNIVISTPHKIPALSDYAVRNYQLHHHVDVGPAELDTTTLSFSLRESDEARHVYETLYLLLQRLGGYVMYKFFTALAYKQDRLYYVDPVVVWFRSLSLLNLPAEALRIPLSSFVWHLSMHGGDYSKSPRVFSLDDITVEFFAWRDSIRVNPMARPAPLPTLDVEAANEIVASINLSDL